eukprot:8413984-Pyramimonas_sp.AAC.1
MSEAVRLARLAMTALTSTLVPLTSTYLDELPGVGLDVGGGAVGQVGDEGRGAHAGVEPHP